MSGCADKTDVRTELGARFDDPTVIYGKPLILFGRLAWAHDFVSNPALGAVFQSLPGAVGTERQFRKTRRSPPPVRNSSSRRAGPCLPSSRANSPPARRPTLDQERCVILVNEPLLPKSAKSALHPLEHRFGAP